MSIEFFVECDDVARVASDVLLLKYAGGFYGADRVVAEILIAGGASREDDIRPEAGHYALVESRNLLAPKRVLFVGTKDLYDFSYDDMVVFARKAIAILSKERISPKSVTCTIHGPGYGLDPIESLQSLIRGFRQGFDAHPTVGTEQITFVEYNSRRAKLLEETVYSIRISAVTGAGTRRQQLSSPKAGGELSGEELLANFPPEATAAKEAPPSAPKGHIFVAMPFSETFEDVYEFGIYAPVRKCGFICEKVDETSFTGDIMQRVRERIETAKLVIADLTESRPNVYLEVGYAWGKGVPVVFLARKDERLHFDVSTHRCIFYKNITQLARDLDKLISNLPIS